jgi:DNA-binding NarL/FixJ family response regulator
MSGLSCLPVTTADSGELSVHETDFVAIRPGRPQPSRAIYAPRASVVSIVLADPAELMHLAVRALVGLKSRFVVVGTATTAVAAEQLVRRHRPGIVLSEADLAGESGIELCRWVRQASPVSQVVILTGRDEPLLARSALIAGAAGFLLKDIPADALVTALGQVAAGNTVVDSRLGGSASHSQRIDPSDELGFSRRERDVLAELVAGLDNRSIAGRLCISEETVKSHLKAVFRKLGARDRSHAVALVLGSALPVVRPGYQVRRACAPAGRELVRQ